MSFSDNPQFDPQAPVSAEPAQITPAPFTIGPDGPVMVAPQALAAPVRDPVWSGWDVLLIAGLTVIAMLVLQLVVICGGAHRFVYPHANLRM